MVGLTSSRWAIGLRAPRWCHVYRGIRWQIRVKVQGQGTCCGRRTGLVEHGVATGIDTVSPARSRTMALSKIGKFAYGDTQLDIRDVLLDYSQLNGYPSIHFQDACCECGGKLFRLL